MFRFKKSQLAVTDLFIALVVALILIILVVFTWNRYVIILKEENVYKEMQLITFQTVDLLIKSSGEPSNWELNPTNVDVIGLASSDRKISASKVDALINLSYNFTSNSLGISYYDFYFQLKHVNGTQLMGYGIAPNNTVVSVQRLVSYKNEDAIAEFALWK